MITRKTWIKRASAAIEFMALIVFILGALLVFKKYILQAFWGQWEKTGQTFGHGRQYDPREFGDLGSGGGTLHCMYVYDDPSDPASAGEWVVQPCFDSCMDSPANSQSDCRNQCGTSTLGDAGYCY